MLMPISQTFPGSAAALPDRQDIVGLRTVGTAAVARPETERAVTSPGATQRTQPSGAERSAKPGLPLPDPDAPTGPPPAFDRSFLEKERGEWLEQISQTPDTRDAGHPTARSGFSGDAPQGDPKVDLRR